jgi:hypothetical protein
MAARPVFLDGPLQGQPSVPIEDTGDIYHHKISPDQTVTYTFTIVNVLGREVVVGSCGGGIPDMNKMAGALLSDAALAAQP